jgi:hypothetical protein
MSSFLVFDRVYRLENGDAVSHFGIFDPALWTAPLTFSLIPPPPPFPPSQSQSTVYTDSVWLGGGGRELSCIGDQEFNTLFLIRFQNLKNCQPNHPKQKPLRGGALRQINTCRKVPLQVNIFI